MTKDASLGLRERNKQHKLNAIKVAARELFREKGFDGTTLREVARRADVGFGTVFAYAADKKDLLAMVHVEELTALPALFPANGTGEDPLSEVVDGLATLFGYWATIPNLSRLVLQHMEFYADSPSMAAIVERRRRAKGEIASWIDTLKQRRRVSDTIDTEVAADTIFSIYTSVVREWSLLTPDDPAVGIARLRQLLDLPIKGLLAPP